MGREHRAAARQVQIAQTPLHPTGKKPENYGAAAREAASLPELFKKRNNKTRDIS